jgi:hypothetical protein
MTRELYPNELPADLVMRGEYVERMPTATAREDLHAYRDQSLDEAEETLLEEMEYWHGYSEVGAEWFFDEVN